MLARYGGAFGTSMVLHAALAGWMAWATLVPAPALQQANSRIEVVLMPPSEDSAFPGLKPVERSGGKATTRDF
jgi:hypothetical protein